MVATIAESMTPAKKPSIPRRGESSKFATTYRIVKVVSGFAVMRGEKTCEVKGTEQEAEKWVREMSESNDCEDDA